LDPTESPAIGAVARVGEVSSGTTSNRCARDSSPNSRHRRGRPTHPSKRNLSSPGTTNLPTGCVTMFWPTGGQEGPGGSGYTDRADLGITNTHAFVALFLGSIMTPRSRVEFQLCGPGRPVSLPHSCVFAWKTDMNASVRAATSSRCSMTLSAVANQAGVI